MNDISTICFAIGSALVLVGVLAIVLLCCRKPENKDLQ